MGFAGDIATLRRYNSIPSVFILSLRSQLLTFPEELATFDLRDILESYKALEKIRERNQKEDQTFYVETDLLEYYVIFHIGERNSMPIDLTFTLPLIGWFLREVAPVKTLWSYWKESRPLSRLLDPFAKPGEPCLIVLPSLNLPKEKPKFFVKEIEEKEVQIHWTEPLMSTYDSIAASYFHSILSRAGKKSDEVIVRQDEDLGYDEMNANLICIGLWSNKIANVANKRSPYFKFGYDGKRGYISSTSWNPTI